MRDANKVVMAVTAAAALGACNPSASETNVAIDINNAAPGDIEQLPPDESVDTSADELANGAADPTAEGANADANAVANAN